MSVRVKCPYCDEDALALVFLVICLRCRVAMTPLEYECAWRGRENEEREQLILKER